MICEQTGKECKQPESCEERGCFKERLGSINLGTAYLAASREWGMTNREFRERSKKDAANTGADIGFGDPDG